MNSIIKFVCATAIAATSTAALFTTTVHARTADNRNQAVKTADLDLSSPSGQERMLRRINIAAREVCGFDAAIRDLRAQRAASDCVNKATSKAMAQIKSRDGQPLALQITE